MRNYFKTLFAKVNYRVPAPPSDVDDYVYAWGGDADSLLEQVRKLENLIRTIYAPRKPTFMILEPQVVWWEINKKNFVTMLNGGVGSQQAVDFFGGTRIGDVNVSTLYYGMTKIGGYEPSPRSTWSHGH